LWHPHLQEEYVQALQSGVAGQELTTLLTGLASGTVTPVDAASRLTHTLYTVATDVFGTFNPNKNVLPSGRVPKRWFRHCKAEYQAVQHALRVGDTELIKSSRREFKRVQRKWKRHYEAVAQESMWHSIGSNPRRFWKLYHGSKSTPLGLDLAQFQQFWEELYGGVGRGALPEVGSSATAVADGLLHVAQAVPGFVHAQTLNEPITEDEIGAGLAKLHLGRAPGPDGLRSEFLKHAWVKEESEDGKSRKVNILVPLLHALFNQVFTRGEYIQEWSSATLSAVFKKGDAASLDNYRAIAIGAVLGKLYAILLETRLTVCAEKQGWRAEGQAG